MDPIFGLVASSRAGSNAFVIASCRTFTTPSTTPTREPVASTLTTNTVLQLPPDTYSLAGDLNIPSGAVLYCRGNTNVMVLYDEFGRKTNIVDALAHVATDLAEKSAI